MSSKVDLLKKKPKKNQIAELQAQLEVEMAKNDNVSDGALLIDIGKKKTIVERTTPKRKVIKEPKSTRVIKKPRIVASIKDVKPVKLGSNDKRKRYIKTKHDNNGTMEIPLSMETQGDVSFISDKTEGQ